METRTMNLKHNIIAGSRIHRRNVPSLVIKEHFAESLTHPSYQVF